MLNERVQNAQDWSIKLNNNVSYPKLGHLGARIIAPLFVPLVQITDCASEILTGFGEVLKVLALKPTYFLKNRVINHFTEGKEWKTSASFLNGTSKIIKGNKNIVLIPKLFVENVLNFNAIVDQFTADNLANSMLLNVKMQKINVLRHEIETLQQDFDALFNHYQKISFDSNTDPQVSLNQTELVAQLGSELDSKNQQLKQLNKDCTQLAEKNTLFFDFDENKMTVLQAKKALDEKIESVTNDPKHRNILKLNYYSWIASKYHSQIENLRVKIEGNRKQDPNAKIEHLEDVAGQLYRDFAPFTLEIEAIRIELFPITNAN